MGPFANNTEAAMEDVYTYLENSKEVCQFPLNKLMDQIKGPEKKTVKAHSVKTIMGAKKIIFLQKRSRQYLWKK